MMLNLLLNKVLVFYFPQKADYWNTVTPCDINTKPCELKNYYLNFESKAYYPDSFDHNKIPLYWYNNKYIYHPIVIAQYALGLFVLIENKEFREKFILQADWLVNNGIERNNGISWELNIDIDEYDIKSPWISAMAQGEAISVLTRAFLLTRNLKYLNVAESALVPFTVEVNKGGIANQFCGLRIFEEYPANKPTAVLNGFIFSIFGLYDLMLLGNKKSEELYLKSIESLKKLLPFYDMTYWSSYDLYNYPRFFPATYTYHMIHVEQLKALYFLTGEQKFLQYAVKWDQYSKNIYFKTKVLLKKIHLGIKNLN